MFIANYVYEKEGAKHKKVMRYSTLPQDKVFTWMRQEDSTRDSIF